MRLPTDWDLNIRNLLVNCLSPKPSKPRWNFELHLNDHHRLNNIDTLFKPTLNSFSITFFQKKQKENMKAIKTTILFLFMMVYGFSQTCDVNPILFDNYEKDVKHLTIIRMEMFDAIELNYPEISQIWQDTIWEGLASIFNSSSIARDQIFDEYCIHHDSWSTGDYLRITQKIELLIDSAASWQQNWIAGNITTNNPTIDSLLDKYGFVEVRPWIPSSTTRFTITTNKLLNVRPIVDSLRMIDGILIASPGNDIGGSRQIKYQLINGVRYYEFFMGWGDCFNGCIFNYSWSFQVDESCNVDFIGNSGNTGGNEFPEPLNCDISQITSTDEIRNPQILIYPNPIGNQITIKENELDNLHEYEFKIIDLFGNEIQKGSVINGQIIYTDKLQSGFYTILIKDQNDNYYIEKLVKK